MHRVDVIFDSALRVELLVADETSIFSSLKFTLKIEQKKKTFSSITTSLLSDLLKPMKIILKNSLIIEKAPKLSQTPHLRAQAQVSLQPRNTSVDAAAALRTKGACYRCVHRQEVPDAKSIQTNLINLNISQTLDDDRKELSNRVTVGIRHLGILWDIK